MACTNIRARSDKIATVVGKRRLQRYLNGKNKEGKTFLYENIVLKYKRTLYITKFLYTYGLKTKLIVPIDRSIIKIHCSTSNLT